MASLKPNDLDPTRLPPQAANQPSSASPGGAPDPFDPASLRLGSDYAEGLGVKRVITTIPCRKPNKTEWFRVRPGDEWSLVTAVLETEGIDRATYLVEPSIREHLADNLATVVIVTCINRAGDPFLWRIKLPGPDGRTNPWTTSALAAAREAESHWCRMVPNMGSGDYSLFTSEAGWAEPKWPDLDFRELLRIAFRDRRIDSVDHPIVRELRGLA